ncbi:MAG TPA: Holliday junction resolvase RuvX [Gammaproteobacteria bacterium]|nr:Holliday junction resolvase RuvX [Gammaproteobacteria bacterium]
MLKHQTVIGFDFGLKHIGVAVGQTVTATANPLASLHAHQGTPKWEKVTELVAYWKPDAFIVGLPYALDGSEHHITRYARRFAQELEMRYPFPVHLVDERFTTLEARRDLFERGGSRALSKRHIDGMSAKIITEDGLNRVLSASIHPL